MARTSAHAAGAAGEPREVAAEPGPVAATVQCQLCPKGCVIAPGQSGECRVRVNVDGVLTAVTYGAPSALHIDPVEKKPLFHFHPGARVLSVATVGCNLHCDNCQNWQLSQTNPEDADTYDLPPEDVVALARGKGTPALAFTYSEPLVYYEYTYDTFRAARAAGLATVLVTAGYAAPGPARELFSVTDATNIDLKFFDDGLYRQITGAHLGPVLDFIVLAREAGVWVELTNLVIPTLNDDAALVRRMARWIVDHVGPDVPLHLSRFYPRYRLTNLPPTPVETLTRLRAVALDAGLHHVYVGNVPGIDAANTYCPRDGTLVVERRGYHIQKMALDAEGRCPTCHQPVAGVWRRLKP